jgi:hypothetical protein
VPESQTRQIQGSGAQRNWVRPSAHPYAEEVSRVAELCIGQGNPTRFRGIRVGVTITKGAFDLERFCRLECWSEFLRGRNSQSTTPVSPVARRDAPALPLVAPKQFRDCPWATTAQACT